MTSTDNPLEILEVPVGFNLENLDLTGFDKINVTFYVPIDIERVDEDIEVSWTAGALQTTNVLGGTWTDVESATSPFKVEATGDHRFFRVNPESIDLP